MSVDVLDEFDFDVAQGAEVGEAAEQEAKSRRPSFNRTEPFRLNGSPEGKAKGEHEALVRFVSPHVVHPNGTKGEGVKVPAWLTVDMHTMVPTKAAPSDWPTNSKWPATMMAVCRNDKVFKARYGDCYICANVTKAGGKKNLPVPRTWALVVRREEVLGDGSEALGGEAFKGQVVGIRDLTKEITSGKEGATTTRRVPRIEVVTQAWSNFFGPLSGFAQRYKTILDRDYYITRIGSGTDTDYRIVPNDPITLPDGSKYVTDLDTVRSQYPDLPDLRSLVAEMASDDYYARFFDPTKAAPPMKKAEGDNAQAGGGQQAASGSNVQTPAPVSSEPSSDQMATLRARILNGSGGVAAQPQQPVSTGARAL